MNSQTSKKKVARASLLAVLGSATAAPVGAQTLNQSPDAEPVEGFTALSLDPTEDDGNSNTSDVEAFLKSLVEFTFKEGIDLSPVLSSIDLSSILNTSSDADDSGETTELSVSEERALQAFLDSSYDSEDAERLAKLWDVDLTQAKITKGKVILGDITEFPPPADTNEPASVRRTQERALEAYSKFYDYDHAVILADSWSYVDPNQAKITKGKFMLGEIENFPRSVNAPGPAPDQQEWIMETYHNVGFDYEYALELSEIWDFESVDKAKSAKGKLVLGLIDELSDQPAAEEQSNEEQSNNPIGQSANGPN